VIWLEEVSIIPCFVFLLFLLVVLLSSSCYVLVSMLCSLRLIILEY
jgi:hypothetical protein